MYLSRTYFGLRHFLAIFAQCQLPGIQVDSKLKNGPWLGPNPPKSGNAWKINSSLLYEDVCVCALMNSLTWCLNIKEKQCSQITARRVRRRQGRGGQGGEEMSSLKGNFFLESNPAVASWPYIYCFLAKKKSSITVAFSGPFFEKV